MLDLIPGCDIVINFSSISYRVTQGEGEEQLIHAGQITLR